MTLTHYIGGKLVGLTVDFPPSLNYPNLTTFINSETFEEFILVSGVWEQVGVTPIILGGWKELGRTTLGAPADTISVTGLPDKRYIMYLIDKQTSGVTDCNLQINADVANSYAARFQDNGGADATQINQPKILQTASGNFPEFVEGYIANLSTNAKLTNSQSCSQGVLGAGNAPSRREVSGKWVNTSNAIDRIDVINLVGGSDFGIGAELVVLGWDPTDDDTGGFWEELADAELTIAGDLINSGTFSTRKYLWYQIYAKQDGQCRASSQFNLDTGTNYSSTHSANGAVDGQSINQTSFSQEGVSFGDNFTHYWNGFVLNIQGQEKLVTGQMMSPLGAGAGVSPSRFEFSGKWADNALVTSIQMNNTTGTGSWGIGSRIKVWGHD